MRLVRHSGEQDSRKLDDAERVEPRLGDGLIGSAIGFVLIYAGSLFQNWMFRWPLMALGALFVVVMTGFVGVLLWQRMAPRLVPILSNARGHIRHDPQLGTLTRDIKAQCWIAEVLRGGRNVEFVIEGTDQPNPRRLATARTLLADFDTLERRVAEYIAREAKTSSEDPEIRAEMLALRISAVKLWLSDLPDKATIVLEGPDEDRYWSCVWERGELSDLDFD
jgi:hypothetical protein